MCFFQLHALFFVHLSHRIHIKYKLVVISYKLNKTIENILGYEYFWKAIDGHLFINQLYKYKKKIIFMIIFVLFLFSQWSKISIVTKPTNQI